MRLSGFGGDCGAAHPRWRGAHVEGGVIGDVDNGLIPAGAGHIHEKLEDARTGRAHPRWRGAHCHLSQSEIERSGSSPLARGTSTRVFHPAPRRGLIPAGAGHILDDLHLQQDSAHFTFNSE